MEDWLPIGDFSNYQVSQRGRVRNEATGKIMTQAVNQAGIPFVGLTRDHRQYRRSVGLLVARAWVPQQDKDAFTTPINKDGDKLNNNVSNLLWRPRWFAMAYTDQFRKELRAYSGPIVDTKTGQKFDDSWDAALEFGLLDRDIHLSIINRTFVWPTYQIFRSLTDRY